MGFNPKALYEIVPDKTSVYRFYKYPNLYVTRPPYQRYNVWPKYKKQGLLDSLFRRYYIPKLVIREVRIDHETTKQEVIDGQQRITTFQEFFDNKIKLPVSLSNFSKKHDVGGHYWEDLPDEVKVWVEEELKIEIDSIRNIDNPKDRKHQEIATEIFWRLQQGEALNFMEVAHARLASRVRNFLVKYADTISFDFKEYKPMPSNQFRHKFFDIIRQKNDRMQHLSLLARFLILEKNDGPTELGENAITQMVDSSISDHGINDDSFQKSNEAGATLKILNKFYSALKDDPMLVDRGKIQELSREYFIISFYLLLRRLMNHYVVDEKVLQMFSDFMRHFWVIWAARDSDEADLLSFKDNRQQNEASIEARDIILRARFFKFLDEKNFEILTKDTRRAFNEYERIVLYRKGKGLCQMCLDEGKDENEAIVPWSNYQADHLVPHAKGGETSLENAQVLCQHHNASKSDKLR